MMLQRMLGLAEYFARSTLNRLGVPLNGQAARQLLLGYLIENIRPYYLVETGTHLGATTEWLSRRSRAVVLAIEFNEKYYTITKMRLRKAQNTTILRGSSARILPDILQKYGGKNREWLFYLDAHWYDFLPLKDELRSIERLEDPFIVVIDDFRHPTDAGYGYDCYGDIGISIESFRETSFERSPIWVPSIPSSIETGARRGCCVLASSGFESILDRCPFLMRWR